MKQSRHEPLAAAVGQLFARSVATQLTDFPDAIVPVPTFWLRRIQRGTSSAEQLARQLSCHLNRPLHTELVKCRRKTKKQGTLSPDQRFRNVKGAYRVSPSYVINGAHLLVVDDVMTTGATASEVAGVLRRAGAETVTVAVVARGTGV